MSFPAWWALCQQPDNDGSANDSDGTYATRWGFIYSTWREARRYMGEHDITAAAFLAMTQADSQALALSYFWERLRMDSLPPGIDVCVMDWMWTSGGAVLDMQQNLGAVDTDGLWGPETRGALATEATPAEICRWRANYYDACGFRQEYPGLYRRTADCLALAMTLIGP